MKKKLKIAAIAAIVLFVVIQLVPIRRTNPPVTGDMPAPVEVKAILKGACYDCHSHETVWPWYSRVAPVSWLVAADVSGGRRKLNFSTWDQYIPKKRSFLLDDASEEIEKRDMPPLPYRLIHKSARLTHEQVDTLTDWLKTQSGA